MSEPHERIERAIAGLGSEHEPPAGWEARVLAATAPKRRWWLIAVPAVALATVIVIVIGLRGSGSAPQPLALAVAIEASGAVVRGTTAKPGDTVQATASGGAGERAVWIYRGDRELVVACSGAKPCRATLATVGTYTVIAVTAKTPLPAPTGSLDDDLAGALEAGASHTTQKIEVR